MLDERALKLTQASRRNALATAEKDSEHRCVDVRRHRPHSVPSLAPHVDLSRGDRLNLCHYEQVHLRITKVSYNRQS